MKSEGESTQANPPSALTDTVAKEQVILASLGRLKQTQAEQYLDGNEFGTLFTTTLRQCCEVAQIDPSGQQACNLEGALRAVEEVCAFSSRQPVPAPWPGTRPPRQWDRSST
uniref:Uncharacterized protein n=1 Tax=Tetraselmis sp. GSL018 TaxID=582737 RepID=A0A061SBI1_9CHLO